MRMPLKRMDVRVPKLKGVTAMQRVIGVRLVGVLLPALMFAIGTRGDEVKGMIMARSGATLIVPGSGGRRTVALNTNTRETDAKGLFGLDTQAVAGKDVSTG